MTPQEEQKTSELSSFLRWIQLDQEITIHRKSLRNFQILERSMVIGKLTQEIKMYCHQNGKVNS